MLNMSEKSEPRVYRLREGSGGGMTFIRYREIEKAEAAGKPLELTDEERSEFEEARRSLTATLNQFDRAFTGNFRAMSARLAGITASSWPERSTTPDVGAMHGQALQSIARQAKEPGESRKRP